MKQKLTTILLLVLFSFSINAQNAWINEFHYDNASGDIDEAIEIVIENAGTYTLSDFQIDKYNGSGGVVYGTHTVDNFTAGTVAGDFTFYSIVLPANGLQNGPDGICLSYQGAVISGQFLSYEGTVDATEGPANGTSSVDIGVLETGTTLVGESLQLSGTGTSYAEFAWQAPATATLGNSNNGQTIGALANDQTSTAIAPSAQIAAGTISSISIDSVPMLRFDITDAASGDGLPTNITSLKFVAGPNNMMAFDNTLINGTVYDLTAPLVNLITGDATLDATSVTLPVTISIPDGATVSFEVAAYISPIVVDGGVLQMQINSASHGFAADISGSGFEDPFAGGDIVGNNFTIEVIATQLSFIDQPLNVEVNATLNTVVVGAVDANNNTDFDFANTAITLTSSGTGVMSGTNPVTTAAGYASFSDLTFDTEETGITLTASGAFAGATSLMFDVTAPFVAPDVFISEYIEGGSSNKAVEIYNGTGAEIADLSAYSVKLGSNGGTWGNNITLSGTLAAEDVFVIANSSAVQEILDVTDVTSDITYFNGDDALGLFYNDVLIDVIGEYLVDPGTAWDVAGVVNGTQNHTITRKFPDVTTGNTDWASSAGTDVDDSEWIVYDQDDFTYIGWHGTPPATPQIGNIAIFPVTPIPTDAVTVSADITDADGTIASASVSWGLATGVYDQGTINMTVGTAPNYVADTDIPAQAEGVTVYYIISATDDGANLSTSNEQMYTVSAPPSVVVISEIQTPTDILVSDASPLEGLTVITTGVVTAFYADGYFIQDADGAWNGILVEDAVNIVALGDEVTVTAMVEESYGYTQLTGVTAFNINSSANTLPGITSLTTLEANDEDYEGVYVQVLNAESLDAAATYGEWTINDGTGNVKTDDLIFAHDLVQAMFYNITGVMYYSFSEAKLLPRDAADIEVVISGYSVTFNVDMTDSIASGYFVEGTDQLWVGGSMNGWTMPGDDAAFEMVESATNDIYTLTLPLEDGDYMYKYFKIVGGTSTWDLGEWTGDPNREFTVEGADLVLNDLFGDKPVSITDLVAKGISIYPNPSNGVFTVNVENKFNLEIFDITGKVVNSKVVNGSSTIQINTNGVYFLRFSNENGSVTQRVIVQ